MKFEYTSFLPTSPQLKFNKRPLVPIEVFYGSESINILGLIDSGADYTLINIEYARALKIDLSRSTKLPMIGIAGAAEALLIPEIDIRVINVGRAIIPVAFINSPSVNTLLGQQGFFDSFRIAFEKYNNSFEIKPK